MPLAERKLIERIAQASRAQGGSKLITAGIGDDCAVLRVPAGHEMLVTTDFSLEGVHFRREWHPADSVGHRCLTRGLSDISAMGGEPLAVFLSLALPADLPQRWADQFLKGMLGLAQRFGVTLAGGDTAQSPAGVMADITVIGSVPASQAILRSGAQPGDSIFVTGELGAPVALLKQMFANPQRKFRAAAFPAHFYPEPQLAVGRQLRTKKLATAMIDISDGLSTDLRHICESSGVGATISERALPIASLGRHEVELSQALHGGDEYQLLFTVPPSRRVPQEIAGVPITRIGYINEGNEILVEHENGDTTELEPGGWEHFSSAASKSTQPARRGRAGTGRRKR
jgi:thiamine-monophosphate kinase